MTGNDNMNIYAMSDGALMRMIGGFIKQNRLNQNKTQQEVAEAAGINRATLSQIENGSSGTMVSLIQILRVLNQLHLLQQFQATPLISPLELARLEQMKRQRSRSKNKGTDQKESDW